MEPSIDIKVISCENIQTFNFFQKLTLYSLISIDTSNPEKTKLTHQQKQQQRTQTHRDPEDEHGTSPIWNHEARFNIGWVPRSRKDLFFRFEFRHDGLILGDKLVGECCVPLLDLVTDAECDVARFVSYEVRNSDGKPNGTFNFSYMVKGISSGAHLSESEILEGRISGYPVVESNQFTVQYPKVEIDKPHFYPSIECCSPSAAAPPYGEYNYYYHPPLQTTYPCPPPPLQTPYPCPPPPLQNPYPYPPPPLETPYPYPPPPPVTEKYPHFGPEAHEWQSGFQPRW